MAAEHRSDDHTRDTESPQHRRATFNDPLPGGMDPTAPGAPHEPGGDAFRQSQSNTNDVPGADRLDSEEHVERPGKREDAI